MSAVLVVTVDDGQAIAVIIERQGKKFLLCFIDFTKILRRRPCPTPSAEAPRGAVSLSKPCC